jgi:hypothetical protein
MYEDLQNFELSVDMAFAKHYILDWFPNLCKAIKNEQEKCAIGDQRGERRFYGRHITRIEPEKLAIISLS